MPINSLRLKSGCGFFCLAFYAALTFSINASASVTPLIQFTGSNGGRGGALTNGHNSFIYGAAATGGANNYGIVFRMKMDGSDFKTLHTFSGPDGDAPIGPLLLASDGLLYGTTIYGGSTYTSSNPGYGTVFSISLAGTKFKSLASFVANGGPAGPSSGVIQDASGIFYGCEGSYIFTYDPATGLLKRIPQQFDGISGFLIGSDGLIYITSFDGGSTATSTFTGYGALYSMATDGSGLQTLHNFGLSGDVVNPTDLIQGSDGFLYGTALGLAPKYINGTPDQKGTVWKIATDGSSYTPVHTFRGADGDEPISLSFGSDGAIYGTTDAGGPYATDPITGIGSFNGGVLFRVGTAGGEFSVMGALGTASLGTLEETYQATHNSLLYISPSTILGCTESYPYLSNGNGVIVSASVSPSVPYITLISPSSVIGAQTSTFTVEGGDFNKTSQVFINGNALATTYQNPTHLLATVQASDVPNGDVYGITVSAPSQPQASNIRDLFVPVNFALGQVTLTQDQTRGGLDAQIQLLDQSSYPAENISLPSATLGTTRGSKPSPNTLSSISPGSPATFTSYFAGSFPSGEQVVLQFGFTQETKHVSLSTTVTTP